jgi:hypothetical protein
MFFVEAHMTLPSTPLHDLPKNLNQVNRNKSCRLITDVIKSETTKSEGLDLSIALVVSLTLKIHWSH